MLPPPSPCIIFIITATMCWSLASRPCEQRRPSRKKPLAGSHSPTEVCAAPDRNPPRRTHPQAVRGGASGKPAGSGDSQPLRGQPRPQRDFLPGDSPLLGADSPPRPVSPAVPARLGLQLVLEGRGARGSPAPPGRPHPRWGPGSRVLRGLLAAGAGVGVVRSGGESSHAPGRERGRGGESGGGRRRGWTGRRRGGEGAGGEGGGRDSSRRRAAGRGIAGAGLTCPLGPGSPDSPCRHREAGSRALKPQSPSPSLPPNPPRPPPRGQLTFSPFSPGRPATPRSPCKLSTASQSGDGPHPPPPPPPPPGTRGEGRRWYSPRRRGVRSSLGSPAASGQSGLGEFPSPGTSGSPPPAPATPGPGHTPLQLLPVPQGRLGPAGRIFPRRSGGLRKDLTELQPPQVLKPLAQVFSSPIWYLVSLDAW